MSKMPEYPTMALPGTEEKILVLQDRFSRRENLWHPLDAIMTDDIEKYTKSIFDYLYKQNPLIDTEILMKQAVAQATKIRQNLAVIK